MNLAPYRQVLSLPGMRLLMVVCMLARLPATAAALTVTLHVVTTLKLDFTAAGVAGAAAMIGVGVGGPVAGRLVDKLGLRPVLIVTLAAQGAYWSIAPYLSYSAIVACAFLAGLLGIPIFSISRQFMAALAPIDQRRPAFALDSMGIEVSYMVGPALAVALVTAFGSRFTMLAVGAGFVLGGLALIVMNPPIRSPEEEQTETVAVPRRQWLRPSFVMLLVISAAAAFVLTATDLSIVASLTRDGATQWMGLAIGLWCAYSLVGGFIYGALHRSISPLTLIGAMCVLTIPVALVGGGWWWLVLALIPAGSLCAPSIAASVDTVSQWVPASARGEAMGLHGTALTCGVAAGAPFAGAIIDSYGPQWGFAAAGIAGLLLVLAAVPLWQRAPDPTASPDRAPSPDSAIEPAAAPATRPS